MKKRAFIGCPLTGPLAKEWVTITQLLTKKFKCKPLYKIYGPHLQIIPPFIVTRTQLKNLDIVIEKIITPTPLITPVLDPVDYTEQDDSFGFRFQASPQTERILQTLYIFVTAALETEPEKPFKEILKNLLVPLLKEEAPDTKKRAVEFLKKNVYFNTPFYLSGITVFTEEEKGVWAEKEWVLPSRRSMRVK